MTPSSSYRYLLLLFAFSLLPVQRLCAQEEDEGEEAMYIGKVPSSGNVRTGVGLKDYRVRFFTGSAEVLAFRNTGLNLTLGARIGFVNLSLSLPLARSGSLVNTEARRTAGNLELFRKWGYIGLNAQFIEGFEETNQQTDAVTYQPDTRLTHLSLYGFRVLDENFSLRAAFKNSERQLRSKGSLLLALTTEYQHLDAEAGTPIRFANGTVFDFNAWKQEKVGVGVGYGYTWALPGGWYVTPLLVAGVELRRNTYTDQRAEATTRLYRLSPRLRGRFAVGYNAPRFFASVRASVLPGYELGTRLNTRIRSVRLALVVGRRFGRPPAGRVPPIVY